MWSDTEIKTQFLKRLDSVAIFNHFEYKEPFFLKPKEFGFCGLFLNFSSLGTISFGSVEIRIDEIENLLSPIFKKNKIGHSHLSTTVSNANTTESLEFSISNEQELEQSIDAFVNHYNEFGQDFFEKHDNTNALLNLLNFSEQIPKGGYFPGAGGLFRRIVISHLTNDPHYLERVSKYREKLENLCDKSNSFKKYLAAYNELVNSFTPTL